ncbi:MAG: O-antigen ligase family protein [Porticoccaceae bacterium]|nr:O-antigen ligase family protein [Porticoccaceae bacterium]
MKLRQFFSFKPLPRIAILLWLTLLSMAARLSIFVRRRAFGDYSSIDRMALLEIILMFIGLVLVMSSQCPLKVLQDGKRSGLSIYAAAIILGIMSALWSPLIAFSAYRALSMFTMFMAVMVAFSYEENFELAEWRFLQIAALVMLMQMIQLTGFSPRIIYAPMVRNNTLGTSAVMIACYCLPEAFALPAGGKRRKMLLIVGIIAFLCVTLGVSSGSNVALLCGLLVAVLLLGRPELIALLLFLGLLLWLSSISTEAIQARIFPNKSEEQIRTMTGRTMLWSMYWERIQDHLLFGEGYAATPRVADFYTTNTHNSFISYLSGTGFVGLAIYLLGLGKNLALGARLALRKTPGAVGATAGMVGGLTNSMTKAFLGEGYFPETLIFFCLFALISLQIGNNGKQQQLPLY